MAAFSAVGESRLLVLRGTRGTKRILVDPIPLDAAALEELRQLVERAAIVATNGNTTARSAQLRAKVGVPVFAHADAVPVAIKKTPSRESNGAPILELQIHAKTCTAEIKVGKRKYEIDKQGKLVRKRYTDADDGN